MKSLKPVLYLVAAMAFALPFARGQERDWTNKAGRIIKAEFVFADEAAVTISMNGKIYLVPLASLSPQSQAMAKELQQAEEAKGKPLVPPKGPKPFPHGKQRILAKMNRIGIPKVQFFQTPLPEVLETMTVRSWENDHDEANPAAKGVHIVADLDGKPAPQVTISLNGMPLRNMLNFTTEMVGWKYEVKDDAIVVSKHGAEGAQKTKTFAVTQGMIALMPPVPGNVPVDPFAPVDPNKVNRIRKFLRESGIRFDAAAGQNFVFDGAQITVTHSSANLAKLEQVLNKLRAKAEKK